MAWTLVLCSIPLALTGVRNYLSGDVLSTGVSGFYRIDGYMGGSGLTGNPNDLALMLNLIIPIAAVAGLHHARHGPHGGRSGRCCLAIAAIVLTFSRAGFLTLAASFVMFLAVLARRKAAGAAVGLLLLAICVPPLLPARLHRSAQHDHQHRSRQDRLRTGPLARHPGRRRGRRARTRSSASASARTSWR